MEHLYYNGRMEAREPKVVPSGSGRRGAATLPTGIGLRIRERRLALGLTQRKAAALGGMPSTWWARQEHLAVYRVPKGTLAGMAAVLGVTPEELEAPAAPATPAARPTHADGQASAGDSGDV